MSARVTQLRGEPARAGDRLERSVAPAAPARGSLRGGAAPARVLRVRAALTPASRRLRLLLLVANGIGLVSILAASSVLALTTGHSPWGVFAHQVLWEVIGLACFVVASHLDYRRVARWANAGLVVTVVALFLVLVPHVGVAVDGSTRWLDLGGLQVQPSELAKLAVVVFLARVLAERAPLVERVGARPLLLPAVAVLVAVVGPVLLQPDMGTAVVVTALVLGLLWAAGLPARTMVWLSAATAGAALVAGWAAPYRRARLLSFLHPWAHPLTSGYQLLQALAGVAGGHLAGVGLGASPLAWGYLPNPYTDFVFAVIASETGLLGALVVLAVFVLLGVEGFRIARRAPDRFGSLLAVGITTWITIQAAINVGAVLGVLPVTGVPLPFVSFGGSSLVIELAAAGLLDSVARVGGRAPHPARSSSQRRSGQVGGLRQR